MKKTINNRHQYPKTKQLNKAVKLQHGFSLIEVLVAAVVLSIGILGVAGLQILGMKGTQQSFMKQQAVATLHSLTERMHSNKQGVAARAYEVTDSDAFDCTTLPVCNTATANCSATDVATVDLHNLICGIKAGSAPHTGGIVVKNATDIVSLVGGKLEVNCDTDCSDGAMKLEIKWTERELGNEAPTNDSIILNTRIAL